MHAMDAKKNCTGTRPCAVNITCAIALIYYLLGIGMA